MPENEEGKNFNDVTSKELKSVMDLLVSGSSKVKVKSAALGETRALYFKGRHAVNAILRYNLEKKPNNKLLNIQTREEACKVLNKCLKGLNYFTPVNKVNKNRIVRVFFDPGKDAFREDELYMILYEGSKLKGYLQGFGIMVTVFSLAVIQIWPEKPRKAVYFVVLTLIGLLMGLLIISIIRFLVNIVCKSLFNLDLWILPNLYEDVSIKENFVPFVKIYRTELGVDIQESLVDVPDDQEPSQGEDPEPTTDNPPLQ